MIDTYNFQVTNVPTEYSKSNYLVHSSKLMNSRTYLKLNDTVYLSVPDHSISIDKLGLTSILRNKYYLSFSDSIKVKIFDDKNMYNRISKLVITVNLLKKNDQIIAHEDELKEHIVKSFIKHFFCKNQRLITTYKNTDLIIDVISKEFGFIQEKTEIQINSQDVNVSVAKNSYLKRDLFRDDYNFEQIGIGGLNPELISIFRRALSTRAVNAKLINKLGINHVKGILLYGPPGTGKTLIAKKIGFMLTPKEPTIINGPEILNKYVGQTEETLREKFEPARKEYKQKGDASQLHVFIFDEIDALFKTRGRQGAMSNVNDSLVNQFLTVIEGVQALNNIFIIAMTNRKDLLDPALLRAGRIGVHIQIKLPDFEGRKQIFRIHTNIMSSSKMLDELDYDLLAQLTENYSGAEIEAVVNNAASFALHEKLVTDEQDIDLVTVKQEHFLKAIDEIVPMYGNSMKDLITLKPENYVEKQIDKDLITFSKSENRLNSIIIFGKNFSGKTSTVTKFALDMKIPYTKLVRAIDIVSTDENSRCEHLISVFKDASMSKESLIILDDIEIIINFAEISNIVSFSNKLYQTLLTILKTVPDDPQNKMFVIVTCGNERLFENLTMSFNKQLIINSSE